MSKRRSFYLSLVIVFITGILFAQDTIPVKTGDMKYREDQFYIGANYNLLSNVPSGVKIRGLSGGVQFGYLRDMPINKRRSIAIAIGVGFSFNEYGQTLFIGETTSEETIFTVLEDDEVDYTRNRFNTSEIEVPIEVRWRSSSPNSYKFWRVYGGLRLGYTYWYKATFKQPGNNIVQTDIPEFEKFRIGSTLSFGYNTFNFFVYYSINPFFKDAITTEGQTVDFRTIRFGLMFYIL